MESRSTRMFELKKGKRIGQKGGYGLLSLMAIACATVSLLELLDKLGIKGALSRESNA